MTHLEQKLDVIIEGMELGHNKKNGVVAAISGGFDPIHPGHIAYINEALKLGDYLLVILTRDEQLMEKDRKVRFEPTDRIGGLVSVLG